MAKLPIENSETGYSRVHVSAPGNKLLFLRSTYELAIFQPPTPGFQPPISYYISDSLWLVRFDFLTGQSQVKKLEASHIEIMDLPEPEIEPNGDVVLHMFTPLADTSEQGRYSFVSYHFDSLLQQKSFALSSLRESIVRQLTFFDGSEEDAPTAKNYNRFCRLKLDSSCIHFSSRYSENYYKELIAWQCDRDGAPIRQTVVPRKTFFFPERTTYKLLGSPMQTLSSDAAYTFLLENRANLSILPDDFRFHEFKRLESLQGATMVAYIMRRDGSMEKKLIYENKEYSCIPLKYEGDQRDMVLYFVRNELERFGLLSLSQL